MSVLTFCADEKEVNYHPITFVHLSFFVSACLMFSPGGLGDWLLALWFISARQFWNGQCLVPH